MANQIFKNQTLLAVELETSYADLASASEVKIYYRKPDGTKGSWAATVDGTKLKYEVTAGDLDQDGPWSFQSGVVVSGREALGTIVTCQVNQSIK